MVTTVCKYVKPFHQCDLQIDKQKYHSIFHTLQNKAMMKNNRNTKS